MRGLSRIEMRRSRFLRLFCLVIDEDVRDRLFTKLMPRAGGCLSADRSRKG
jgi:hypothetical protein